jgi:hypothetical protein
MSARLSIGVGLLVALAAGWPAAAAEPPSTSSTPAAATPPDASAVAVLPLEIVGNVPAGRPALDAAVMRGLTMFFAGATIEPTASSARLGAAAATLPCEDAACWTAAGKAVGARHLLAGRVEHKGPNFEVQFRLIDGPSGRLLGTETSSCEAADCSVAELTRQTVRELARQTLSELPTAPPGPVAPATTGAPIPLTPGAPGPSSSEGAALGLRQEADRPAGPSTLRKLLPYGAIALGAGAAAAGGWVIYKDGSCSQWVTTPMGSECNHFRDQMWEGVALTGVGAALLATGIIVAITDHADPGAPVVLVGPGSLRLAGRF